MNKGHHQWWQHYHQAKQIFWRRRRLHHNSEAKNLTCLRTINTQVHIAVSIPRSITLASVMFVHGDQGIYEVKKMERCQGVAGNCRHQQNSITSKIFQPEKCCGWWSKGRTRKFWPPGHPRKKWPEERKRKGTKVWQARVCHQRNLAPRLKILKVSRW